MVSREVIGTMGHEFALKRAYDPVDRADGLRVLVDRLWPRGVARERAAIDVWAKDLAPSAGLRTWWHREPERFDEFAARYRSELDASGAIEAFLASIEGERRVTLVYAARHRQRNHALVLVEVLRAAAP